MKIWGRGRGKYENKLGKQNIEENWMGSIIIGVGMSKLIYGILIKEEINNFIPEAWEGYMIIK